MQDTLFFSDADEHIINQWGDDMPVAEVEYQVDELRLVEQEIMLAINERLLRRGLLTQELYDNAKNRILQS